MLLSGKLLQFVAFFGGCFSILQCGFNLGWPSYALPYLLSNTSSIPITNDESSWITSIFFIGGIIGSILTALTLDVFGRKTMLVAMSLPICGVWLLMAYAETSVELLVARFLAGLFDGVLFPTVPLYFAEIFNPKIRGLVITSTQVVHIFGIFLSNLLGAFLSIYSISLITFALVLGGSSLYLFIPESPHFYVVKDDIEKARDSIERFNGVHNTDTDQLLKSIRDALKESKKGKWWELFTDASNRKSLCIMIMSRAFQQFSGFIGIIFYARTLFEETEDDVNPIVFVSIFYLLQIVVMIISAATIDKIGRRPLLIGSTISVAIALSIVSIYFTLQNVAGIDVSAYSWFPIFGLFLYITGFTLGLQGVFFLIVNEIFPLHVKTFAVSAFSISYGVYGTIVSKFFQYTKDRFGLHVPFIVFSLSTMCAVPFFMLCIPETKKKSLEDIQRQIRTK